MTCPVISIAQRLARLASASGVKAANGEWADGSPEEPPPRLGPPGGPKVAGTNPLAIGIPSSDGEPVVVDYIRLNIDAIA